MHIVKPSRLSINVRPLESLGRMAQAITTVVCCGTSAESAQLMTDQSLWSFLTHEGVQFFDDGIVKTGSEFIVWGNAYTTESSRSAVAVSARLDQCEKQLVVFGDRHWNERSKFSDPQPFVDMPLSWERAYGGEEYLENPVGKGLKKEQGVFNLPNIELPSSRLSRADANVRPGGFRPLSVTHPQRAALQGTYDESWLKNHSPGLPSDIDWKCFNVAPRDQWLDQPLKGDESFAFQNMHPTKPLIEGHLPGLCARVFANYRIGPVGSTELKVREIPMNLTTVWFFPHAERLVLIFHGLAPTVEPDGSDIVQLMGALDRIDARRSQDYFVEVLRKRTVDKHAGIHMLMDGDLLPEGVVIGDPEEEKKLDAMKPQGLSGDAAYRRAYTDFLAMCTRMRAQGKDPVAMGLRMPEREKLPTIAELPAYLDKAEKENEKQQWESVEKMVTAVEELVKRVKSGKVKPEELVERGPPTYKAVDHLKELEQKFTSVGKPFDRQMLAPKFAQREAIGRLNYLLGAHTQAPAPPLKDAKAAEARREIEWLLARGIKTLPGWNFTGVDLSYLDLRRVDFTGAWMESANLSNANLSHANLTAAVLAHADLRGLVAIKTNFESANLGRAQLERAVFDGSNFAGAIFEHCDFHGSQLPNAKLSGAQMLEATFGRSDWGEASAHSLIFNKRDLKGMVFVRAQMTTCTFIECDLSGVDFRGADLTGGTFVGCNADGANFAGANLERAMFVQKTTLRKADLSGAILKCANLAECDLAEAKLVRTNLDGANLTMTSMADVDGRRLSAKGAMLRKATLLRSECSGADFKDAILQYADLRDTRLREANFYGSDLARVRLTKDTDLDKTHMKRARIYPRLTPEQQAALP